ncbi:MAG: MOSC domain-containing protein, partial [Acetobacteraceae bacterium]
IDRAYPEVQLAEGLGADVDYSLLVLGGGAPPGTFLDYAAMHLMPTATLDAIAASMPDGMVEPERYRPNVIIRSPSGTPGFSENTWADSIVRIGERVMLRVILLTPRCSIPMLAHGNNPPRPAALRVVAEQNRVEIPGFGNQPCAGVYVSVLQDGIVRKGDRVTIAPA